MFINNWRNYLNKTALHQNISSTVSNFSRIYSNIV